MEKRQLIAPGIDSSTFCKSFFSVWFVSSHHRDQENEIKLRGMTWRNFVISCVWKQNRENWFFKSCKSLRYPHENIRLQHNQWCRRLLCRGWKRTLKSFDLSKIRAKTQKTWAKSLKIRENMAPNVCRKTQNYMKTFFWGQTKKRSSRKFVGKCRTKAFRARLGKFGKKILCTPKNVPVPTRMDITYSTYTRRKIYVAFLSNRHNINMLA